VPGEGTGGGYEIRTREGLPPTRFPRVLVPVGGRFGGVHLRPCVCVVPEPGPSASSSGRGWTGANETRSETTTDRTSSVARCAKESVVLVLVGALTRVNDRAAAVRIEPLPVIPRCPRSIWCGCGARCVRTTAPHPQTLSFLAGERLVVSVTAYVLTIWLAQSLTTYSSRTIGGTVAEACSLFSRPYWSRDSRLRSQCSLRDACFPSGRDVCPLLLPPLRSDARP